MATAEPISDLGAVYQNNRLRLHPAAEPVESYAQTHDSSDPSAVAKVLMQRLGLSPEQATKIASTISPEQANAAAGAPSLGNDFDPTALLGIGGAGAAGYALYRLLKGRGGGGASGADVGSSGGAGTGSRSLDPGQPGYYARGQRKQGKIGAPGDSIIEGEFSEVPKALTHDDSAVKSYMRNRQGVKEIDHKPTRLQDAVKARVGPPKLPAPPPPPATVKEPLDAGLARTLGQETELAKMLKANPGLLRTLTRIR